MRNLIKKPVRICEEYHGERCYERLKFNQDKENQIRRTDIMNVRQRVLEARLAEKACKNPALAKQMGIEISYHRETESKIEKNTDHRE